MWSRKYDKCIRCGKNDSPHNSRGVCRKCYRREYVRKNKDKISIYGKKYREEHPQSLEQELKILQDIRIRKGFKWLVNVKDRINQKGLRIEDIAKTIKMTKWRLKLMVNQDIMAGPRDQWRIANYFRVKPEEIFSKEKD